ncbi:DDE-type integrase/transposase/recombinase [Mycoplasmopsis caviae]|uniref:Integrase catalytic domain-containing protein n=1 Tax=Mycoplasmopsis caviae TaxID=55603 RepID=A0A3P8MET1_9BACT|nr:DDE-type integrase/transposase/recombinase [Mycoplasmopsis caviae]VDR42256.1 Uncharacterised protein [Mycoplasmopsis caviae]
MENLVIKTRFQAVDTGKTTDYEDKKNFRFKKIQQYWNRPNAEISKILGKLGCRTSTKTIKRYRNQILIASTNNQDAISISHGNKNKLRGVKVSDSVIIDLTNRYYELVEHIEKISKGDLSVALLHFYNNELTNDEKKLLPFTTFYKRMLRLGYCSSYATRKVKKWAKRRRMFLENGQDISKIEAQFIKIYEKILNKNPLKGVYQNKSSDYDFGQIIEIDATPLHLFGESKKYHIYNAVDAATKSLLAIWIDIEETTIGYQNLLTQLFKRYGIPQVIITDRRRTFWGSDSTRTAMEEALNARGIELITSSNPKAKPNVERSFWTLQRWIGTFFHTNGINCFEDFLGKIELLIDEYNKQFKKAEAVSKKSNVFRKPNTEIFEEEMNLVIKRKIVNHTVRYDNKYLAPFDNNGARVSMFESGGAKLMVTPENKLFFVEGKRKYEARVPKGNELSAIDVYAISKNLDPQHQGVRATIKTMLHNRTWTSSTFEKLENIFKNSANPNNKDIEFIKKLLSENLEKLNDITKEMKEFIDANYKSFK